jgi:hypothetical protein
MTFKSSGICFDPPAGLTMKVQNFDAQGFRVFRFKNPNMRMELNLMAGNILEVVKNATQTAVTYYTPVGQTALTPADRQKIAGLLFEAIAADSAVQSLKPLSEHSGSTPHGNLFREHVLGNAQGVLQATTFVWQAATDRCALIGYRASSAHQSDMETWKNALRDSIEFPNAA